MLRILNSTEEEQFIASLSSTSWQIYKGFPNDQPLKWINMCGLMFADGGALYVCVDIPSNKQQIPAVIVNYIKICFSCDPKLLNSSVSVSVTVCVIY